MTEMSQERLEVCTKTISEALPQITESLENIVSMVNSAAQDVNTRSKQPSRAFEAILMK
jgi:hypothetical protein